MAGLFKRGDIWWTRVPNPEGGRKLRVSTGCTDKKAAEAKARDIERRAVDPTYRAANETRLSVAADRFLAECNDRDLAQATRDMYGEKARHLTRGFAIVFADRGVADPFIHWIDPRAVAAYVELRKSEGAHPHSIQKELVTLRGVLSLARHREEYARNPDEVMPRHFSAKYEPRTDYLDEADAHRLLDALPSDRAAHVAFIIATGARLSEAQRAHREDVDIPHGVVHIRGTKTAKSRRKVPIVSLSAPYLYRAIADAPRTGPMFRDWPKPQMHRDLKAACLRAGIARWVDAKGEPIDTYDPKPGQPGPKRMSVAAIRKSHPGAHVVGSVSANDLRRSFATWLLLRGVDTYLISKVLGHVDTKMLERVYGQMDAGDAGRLIEARLMAPIHVRQLCAPVVSTRADSRSAE